MTPRRGALVTSGRVDYLEAWAAMRRLAELRREDRIPDVVWLLEHPPTYTYGRHGSRADLFVDDATLARVGASCVASDRGGQMTWHGPGQTVGYAVVDLRRTRAVRRFVEALVGAMADAARMAGVESAPGADAVGVYTKGAKLGSVGIRVAGGITTHGLALNRDPDPIWFERMTACAQPGVRATSIALEGGDPRRETVDAALAEALAERLGLRLAPATLEDLAGEDLRAA